MIPRMTTVGTLKNYRYDLNRSNNTMSKAMNTVTTGRLFNSYAENPAIATRCFQLRRSYQRAASQLTVNDSLYRKYSQAWSALEEGSQDIYALADDATFGSLIRSLNGADASGRNALGQSMAAKAKNLVQIMNGRHGENYVFSGADTLNVPFTWEARTNPEYIDEGIAQEKLEAGNLTAAEQAKYASAFEYKMDPTDPDFAKGILYTNDEARAEKEPQPNPDYDPNQPAAGTNLPYLDEKGNVTDDPGAAKQIPVKNQAYNEKTAYRYVKSDGSLTGKKEEAQSALCYRGVPVDANPGTEDGKKLEYFLKGETKNLDVGLGHAEKDGEAVSSTVFNSALQGVYYLGGTGTKEVTATVTDKDGNVLREVTKEVPNNIISVIARMGEILQRCSNEDGAFSEDDEDEYVALARQFEDQKDLYIQRLTELDTETGFLRDNSLLLTDTADSLSQQFMAMEDVDPAAAISDYMFARYCYDAALKVGNSVLSQSLMDYMNF